VLHRQGTSQSSRFQLQYAPDAVADIEFSVETGMA
jgi:hypothetical protein